jgi:hypothetical protein
MFPLSIVGLNPHVAMLAVSLSSDVLGMLLRRHWGLLPACACTFGGRLCGDGCG